MADSRPTTSELYEAKALTEEDIGAAVDAFVAAPTTTPFVFGDGDPIDLAEAVRSHPRASERIRGGEATAHRKRIAVRTAILLARTERA